MIQFSSAQQMLGSPYHLPQYFHQCLSALTFHSMRSFLMKNFINGQPVPQISVQSQDGCWRSRARHMESNSRVQRIHPHSTSLLQEYPNVREDHFYISLSLEKLINVKYFVHKELVCNQFILPMYKVTLFLLTTYFCNITVL